MENTRAAVASPSTPPMMILRRSEPALGPSASARAFAAAALAVASARAARQPVAQLTPLPPRRLLTLLRMPDIVFRLAAARMLRIDAKARSSMADDLAQGRTTEIDALCGEVVRLAQRLERVAPLNARMLALVEAWPSRRQPYSPTELLQALQLD